MITRVSASLGVVATLVLLVSCVSSRPTSPAAPASPAKRWWKGNTHTHTLWSDGDTAPEAVGEWYRRHDYNFLVLSDHNILSEGEKWFPIKPDGRLRPEDLSGLRARFGDHWIVERDAGGQREMRLKTLDEIRARFERPGQFIFIQGEEITDSYDRLPVHVNGMHLAELVDPQGGTSVRDTMQRNIDAVVEQGRRLDRPTLAHVNHPNFGWAFTPEDLATLRGERFFEVYNGHPGVRNDGDADRPSTERMWDIALTTRFTTTLSTGGLPPLYGLATDDAHTFKTRGRGSNPGRGWVMVHAAELTPEAILGALDAGDFYASSGVVVSEFAFDDDAYRLVIEPTARTDELEYTTRFIGTRRIADGCGPIGEVLAEQKGLRPRYVFRGDELYVRPHVISSRPHPNPYKAGDLEQAWLPPMQPAARHPAPPDAEVLFDGRDASQWSTMDGEPCPWIVEQGGLTVRPGRGSIRTRARYGDFVLSIEFMVPEVPDAIGQSRGNSGVYLQNRYEVQILDSYGDPPTAGGAGAVYGLAAPVVNAARPAGRWQHYLISFTASRFDETGRKDTPARITVEHNGVLIHDDRMLPRKTGAGAAEGPEPGPIVLQDHGASVRFRNVWIKRTDG